MPIFGCCLEVLSFYIENFGKNVLEKSVLPDLLVYVAQTFRAPNRPSVRSLRVLTSPIYKYVIRLL